MLWKRQPYDPKWSFDGDLPRYNPQNIIQQDKLKIFN